MSVFSHDGGSTCRRSLGAWCTVVIGACVVGLLVPPAVGDGPLSGEEQFDALRKRYAANLERFNAEQDLAKSEEERTRLGRELWPANTMVEEFLALEAQHRKTLVGLSALHQVVSAEWYPGPEDPSAVGKQKALRILSEHYADHEDIDLFFDWLRVEPFATETKTLLRRAAESSHRHVHGNALVTLARLLMFDAEYPARAHGRIELVGSDTDRFAAEMAYFTQFRRHFAEVDTESSRREALQLIERVIKEYPDVLEPPRTSYGPILLQVERAPKDSLTLRMRRTLAELAESMRFELTKLSIGQSPPEIAGPDAFGNELKLSDQRGKVVVLMFSFKGCGPCEGMYSDNRKLIEKYSGRPLTFVGVMGDTELATVKEAVAKGKITWRVWWDGQLKGPIATRWNVNAWPEIYVLDHQGVIRYRELRGELLERAVARLVESAERD